MIDNMPPKLCTVGRIAIGARVSFLWEHTRVMRNVCECAVLAIFLLVVMTLPPPACGEVNSPLLDFSLFKSPKKLILT